MIYTLTSCATVWGLVTAADYPDLGGIFKFLNTCTWDLFCELKTMAKAKEYPISRTFWMPLINSICLMLASSPLLSKHSCTHFSSSCQFSLWPYYQLKNCFPEIWHCVQITVHCSSRTNLEYWKPSKCWCIFLVYLKYIHQELGIYSSHKPTSKYICPIVSSATKCSPISMHYYAWILTSLILPLH